MNYREQINFKWYNHMLFWMGYVLFWSVRDLVHHDVYLENVQLNALSATIYAGMAYANVYFLVPTFLLNRKYLTYLMLVIAGLTVTAIVSSQAVQFFLIHVGHEEAVELFGSIRGMIILSFEAILVTLITLAIVLVKIYVVKDNDTRDLIKKNLETELNFLKNQINPHFLFNSLNSIYFLIPKNQKKAAEILLKFSDMLSHQLYQGNKDFIPLQNEIKYLENYMELEKVRQGDRVEVDWKVVGRTDNIQIPPMIFLTFLENAFKHGQQTENTNYKIEGELKIDHNELTFLLKNDMPPLNGNGNGTQGVGLENTKRRLELLYPGHHALNIDQADKKFSVELSLDHHEN